MRACSCLDFLRNIYRICNMQLVDIRMILQEVATTKIDSNYIVFNINCVGDF